MRQITWLKTEVNKDPTLACLSVLDLLAPEYVDDVVNAVKSISQSSVSERGQQVLSKPSLALQIGQSIVKCCNLKKGLGIRSSDKAMTAAAEQFLVLHIAEWTDEVSSTPLASMKVKKNYTVAELPNTSDFLKLKQYCKSRMSELTDKLNSGATERKSGPTKGKLIAQRMRQMTWLKMEVNKDPTLASLSVLDLLAPQYVDDVVNAVKSISQSSVSERGQQVLSKPSLALQIGQSIVKCCNLKIRSRDKAMTAAAEQFLVLHIAEWTDEVSSTPLASMKVKKNYTVAEVPNTSDFLKLKQYCKSRIYRQA